jgi:glycosyltransferase involved in cell wall biosynthesis
VESDTRPQLTRGLRIGIDALAWNRRSGYGRHCRELVSALLRLPTRHSFTLMMEHDAPAPGGVDVLRFQAARAATRSMTRRFTDLIQLAKTIMRAPVDVWFFPSPQTFAPVLSRARVLVAIHDTLPWQFPHLIFAGRAQQLAWRLKVAIAMRQSTYVITVSDHAREKLSKYFRMPDSKLRVIGEAPAEVFKPSLDVPTVALFSERIGIPRNARVIAYHGALAPHKDLPTLVTAFARLNKLLEFSDVYLVLTGTSDWVNLRGEAYSLTDACKTLDRVKLPGSLDDTDLALLLNRATIAVLPSLDEGFGLTGLEAVACGTPLIATRSSALPDVLGSAAVYFTPGAEQELYACLVDLLRDSERRKAMREAGLAKVSSMSWETPARQLLSVFDEVSRRQA